MLLVGEILLQDRKVGSLRLAVMGRHRSAVLGPLHRLNEDYGLPAVHLGDYQ